MLPCPARASVPFFPPLKSRGTRSALCTLRNIAACARKRESRRRRFLRQSGVEIAGEVRGAAGTTRCATKTRPGGADYYLYLMSGNWITTQGRRILLVLPIYRSHVEGGWLPMTQN